MSRKRRRGIVGECVYCGRSGPLTADHVPPKNLFPPPRPVDLITVPSCEECNAGFEKDDEYLRLVTAMRWETGDHPDVKGPLAAALRSLKNPKKEGFRRAFTSGLRFMNFRTPAGIYLGRMLSYRADLVRLNRTAERIVKGLFFHHIGRRLPGEAKIKALCLEGVQSDLEGLQMLQETLTVLQRQALITKGQGAFGYRYFLLEDNPDASVWLFSFYEKIHFVGLTVGLIEAAEDQALSLNTRPQADA